MKFLSRLFLAIPILALTIGSAQATIVPSVPYNLTNGSLADATQVMGNFNTIVIDVNANAAHNGVNTDITALSGLTTAIPASLGGTVLYTGGTSGGTANAQTVTPTVPSAFTLTSGNIVTFKAGASNTTALTLNVASTGATAVNKASASGPTALTGGEVISGNSYTAYFDGTRYMVLNPSTVVDVIPGTSGNVLTSNGTAWTSAAPAPTDFVLLDTKTASSSATLDFTSSINSTYSNYIIELIDIVPSSSGASLDIQLSENAGSSWLATGYAWAVAWTDTSSSGNVTALTSDTKIQITRAGGVTTGNNTGLNGFIKLHAPSGTALNKPIFGELTCYCNSALSVMTPTGYYTGDTGAINGVRIIFSTGTVSSGVAKLYGVR